MVLKLLFLILEGDSTKRGSSGGIFLMVIPSKPDRLNNMDEKRF